MFPSAPPDRDDERSDTEEAEPLRVAIDQLHRAGRCLAAGVDIDLADRDRRWALGHPRSELAVSDVVARPRKSG